MHYSVKYAHVRACEHFTFAKQIFHSEAISLARRANFVEKNDRSKPVVFSGCGDGKFTLDINSNRTVTMDIILPSGKALTVETNNISISE